MAKSELQAVHVPILLQRKQHVGDQDRLYQRYHPRDVYDGSGQDTSVRLKDYPPVYQTPTVAIRVQQIFQIVSFLFV